MTTGIWVLGDQLWLGQAALSSFEQQRKQTPLILIESRSYVQRRLYHRQKLVLMWSAMRHFAEELRSAGWSVTYEIANDFETPLLNWIKGNQITQVQVMAPNDRPFAQLQISRANESGSRKPQADGGRGVGQNSSFSG